MSEPKENFLQIDPRKIRLASLSFDEAQTKITLRPQLVFKMDMTSEEGLAWAARAPVKKGEERIVIIADLVRVDVPQKTAPATRIVRLKNKKRKEGE